MDRRWMEGVAQRDMNAFEALFERFRKPLLNYFYRHCWDADLAEDCLQEVFMRVWQAAPDWEPQAKVATWIFTIARNFWINEAARARKRPTPLDPTAGRGEGAGLPDQPAPSRHSPEESATRRESARKVQDAVDGLPDHEREVILLYRYHDFSYREIAEILDIPEGTVKSRMHSALQNLRDSLS